MQHEHVTTPSVDGLSRRELLARCGNGVGMLGLAAVLASQDRAASAVTTSPLASKRSHFPAKAKRIIHLWMNGGPSQVDTFDPKPELVKYAGQRPAGTKQFTTENDTNALQPSPFRFSHHGKSGLEISDIFPHLARFADDLCIIRSMHTDVPVHESANLMMFTGSIQPIRPSYGSWLLYGLGTDNENLPGFVVLGEGLPVNGPSNWSNRFLPGIYQGCQVTLPKNYKPQNVIPYLHNTQMSAASQRRQLDLLQNLNALHRERHGSESAFNARIEAMELAFRMQTAAAEAFDVSKEPKSIQALYGITGPEASLVAHADNTVDRTIFGRNCLLARRLVERGVRVVQIYCGKKAPWDTHANHNNGTRELAQVVDKPIAALLADLKSRGLLDETLVLWSGEFGRTPAMQGKDGRDHNHWGYSVWLAGGGVKGGLAYGATDEFGFAAVENRVHIHDLNATLLHLMGLDHEKLTYHYGGRDYRLTDVSGHVVKDIIA
jgi:Protein of unknown function (DUF1501)